MAKLQKKITAYTLLLLIAIPIFFSLFFTIRQRIVQEEALEQLETVSLQTVTVPLKSLHWVDKDKEAIIDGKLFDVRSYTVTATGIVLTGLYDGKEDELVQQMNGLLVQKNGGNEGFNQIAAKFFFLQVYKEQPDFSILYSWHFITQRFSRYTELTSEEFSSLSSPPPRFV